MYSYSHPTALVIGAGLGGIATAARLARAGFNVKVLEKQEAPGGRCSQLIRDGHRFDTGATLFLMPEVFAETYTALGERMENHLDLHRIDPTYRIRFEDNTQLSLTSNLNAMEAQLEAIEPGSFGGMLRYLVEGHESYHLCLQRFVGRNFYNLPQYFSLQNLPLLFKLKALVKHYDNIGHYFQDPHLKAAFTFQNMYLGLSPFDAPARTDPSAAPLGQDTLMVLVPAGHLDTGIDQDWHKLQARARSAVINRLAASVGVVDLEQHLKFEVSYTPCDWLSMYNLAKGAAFGLSHNFMQVGYLRPHNRHHRYSNLYFVGSSTHPGTGLPMVLLSARLTTERILKEIGVPYPALNLRPLVAG
jgi:phytoene dehydrogenase-like protein